MSSLVLTLDLVGAVALGYFIGFAYTKIKLSHKHELNVKTLKDLLNNKNSDFITLQKEMKAEFSKRKKLEDEIKTLHSRLDKKIKRFNILKNSIKELKLNIKEKNLQIKELETLLLEIQNDFTTLNEELHIQKEINNSQREEFKKKIDELTQKANDLYMVKGTEELKHAKAIFNKLREESLNNI
jgi:chromosome segregation ATPase